MQKSERAAIITGASRGIGFAVANELASMGYSLGIISRSENEINEASKVIVENYPEIKIITGNFDVSDCEKAKDFVSRIENEFGKISVLVNNAGHYKTGTSEMSSDEMFELMNTNFLSAVCFSGAVIPGMKLLGFGYIFSIASICGIEAYPDVGGYVASKFALVGYSDSLAQELESFGIKVTAICPGWVNTEMASSSPINPEEMIQISDISKSIGFLLSLGKTAFIRKIVIHSK